MNLPKSLFFKVLYSIYHCFLAIAAKWGYESTNQTCTIALMRFINETNKIRLDEKFITLLEYEDLEGINGNRIINLREDYTYGVQISIKENFA